MHRIGGVPITCMYGSGDISITCMYGSGGIQFHVCMEVGGVPIMCRHNSIVGINNKNKEIIVQMP